MAIKTLVVGSTGATGKHVVLQLLQQKQNVHAIARSKERLLDLLDEIEPKSRSLFEKQLEITEASILDLSDEELRRVTEDVDVVVSCLGHNISFKGIYGKPRKLVTDATRRLFGAIEANQTANADKKTKFILMGTCAVPNPAGGDDPRTRFERAIIFMLRYLIPPHSDNETAAGFISGKRSNPHIEWTVIRPTDLIDGSVTKYELFGKPQSSLFGGESTATRANVAKSMVDMIMTDSLWEEWKFKMPYIQDMI
jgi:NAD(P)-dependent dehydrogenase (short-subunit alcohol dehydrogenase family)